MRETEGANVMTRHANKEVVVVDVGTDFDLSHLKKVKQKKVAWGTEDFTVGPAMTKEQAIKALQVGIDVANEAIDNDYNMLITAEMWIGHTTS